MNRVCRIFAFRSLAQAAPPPLGAGRPRSRSSTITRITFVGRSQSAVAIARCLSLSLSAPARQRRAESDLYPDPRLQRGVARAHNRRAGTSTPTAGCPLCVLDSLQFTRIHATNHLGRYDITRTNTTHTAQHAQQVFLRVGDGTGSARRRRRRGRRSDHPPRGADGAAIEPSRVPSNEVSRVD